MAFIMEYLRPAQKYSFLGSMETQHFFFVYFDYKKFKMIPVNNPVSIFIVVIDKKFNSSLFQNILINNLTYNQNYYKKGTTLVLKKSFPHKRIIINPLYTFLINRVE